MIRQLLANSGHGHVDRQRTSHPPANPAQFQPTRRNGRCERKARVLDHHEDIYPHHHAWGQLVLSVSGAVRVNTEHHTFIVPPSRAVWIPPT